MSGILSGGAIDLERVVSDPIYRRIIVEILNAEARGDRTAMEAGLAGLADIENPPAKAVAVGGSRRRG